MVSTDCFQIEKFDESYYQNSSLIQNGFIRLIKMDITFGINGLGRPKSMRNNSKNSKTKTRTI